MIDAIKQLGQNFLTNENVITTLVDTARLQEDDLVVEIGPGLGALTGAISSKLSETGCLYAIEFDRRCVDYLCSIYKLPQINIINADILNWLPQFSPKKPYKVIGSLPYYITSPILHTLVEATKQPESIVVLIQKEVGEKISSKTPKGNYLSTFLQTFYEVTYVDTVAKEEFRPIPKVDGAIISLNRINSQVNEEDIKKYQGYLHKGFSNPRKMINKVFTSEELSRLNLDGTLRPQDISVQKWVEMFYKN